MLALLHPEDAMMQLFLFASVPTFVAFSHIFLKSDNFSLFFEMVQFSLNF